MCVLKGRERETKGEGGMEGENEDGKEGEEELPPSEATLTSCNRQRVRRRANRKLAAAAAAMIFASE